MPLIASDYKDRLFNFIFGNEQNRGWTLSLYNAVNGTKYSDPASIEINTIKEVLYLGMHNDVSFLISPETSLVADTERNASEVNLYEQQSSYNPNMPLRLLQYLGSLYEKYLTARDLNKYGSELIRLPAPRLIVFYNGEREIPDEQILRLSDAFSEGAVSDVEVMVRMLNINDGRNKPIQDACKPLSEYSQLIAAIRRNYKAECLLRYGLEYAPRSVATKEEREQILVSSVEKSLTAMPADSVIKPFLDAHKAEVKDMLLTEYNEAEAMRLFFLDGERSGEKKGEKKGRDAAIYEMVQDGDITIARAAQKLNVSEKQVRANMILLGFKIPAS